jgi:hypothetical protein
MRKWERELKEIPGVMSLEMGGKHIKLRLSNSRLPQTDHLQHAFDRSFDFPRFGV